MHAEVSCMHNVKDDYLSGADILVVRITPTERLANSKPCKYCMKIMRKKGIKRAYYSINPDLLGMVKVY